MGGPYALDWSVVIKTAEACDICIDKTFFKLLRAFENTIIGEMNNGEPGS